MSEEVPPAEPPSGEEAEKQEQDGSVLENASAEDAPEVAPTAAGEAEEGAHGDEPHGEPDADAGAQAAPAEGEGGEAPTGGSLEQQEGEAAGPANGEGAEAAGGPPTEGGEEGRPQPAEGEEAPAEGDEAAVEGGEEGAEGPVEEAEAVDVVSEGPQEPPPPPPYVPPEVGEDYVPVAQLPPLPLPYGTNEEGKPVPLPGSESLFLTGTTLEMVGLSGIGSDKEGGHLFGYVSKETLLKDIQFRGAISDFHAFKAKIQDADYDPICMYINEDDIFGDGNNFQMAARKEVADTWSFILEETARRKQLLIDEQIRAAIEKSKPRSKKARKVKPWVSQGSEVEIDEATVRPRRDPVRIIVTRKRAEFNQAFKMADKDAHELWNSSQMECRPFKDPNFDLRRAEQDVGVQAVPPAVDQGVQVGADRPRPKAVQYAPLDLLPVEKQAAVKAPQLSKFLDRVSYLCEEALIQNEVTNIFSDDFSTLTDEEGMTGNRKESIVSEYQSFTHLTYSKNKVVSAIQWLPHRKGVVAVACTEALSHTERVARAGRPANAYILIWNFKDPIHPEYVLQAPYEIFSFQYNPANPEVVAGGCYNGQVVLWDTTHEHERIARMKAASSKQDTQDASDEATIPIVKCKYVSSPEFSHHSVVLDLQWLPGVEITSRGKLNKAADGSKECAFVATTAGDGKVNFWDIRVDRLMKKGRKAEDALDLVWKPTHAVHLISLIGMDLGGVRMCFHLRALDTQHSFFVGSADGELVYADMVKPEGEENPDYIRSSIQAHVGPVVALERSPFFDDIILTVGDWSFQVWREGHPTPLFNSGYAPDMYTCGCWSPTRPAVIYLADQAGNLQIWDMLDRSHEPSIKVTLASTPFMSMSFMGGGAPAAAQAAVAGSAAGAGAAAAQQHQAQHQAQNFQFLALGDSAGVLRIVELPRNLRRPVPNERKLMGVFLDREAERVADVGGRKAQREAANKAAEEARKRALDEAEAAAKDAAAKDQAHPPPSKAAAAAAAQKAAMAATIEADDDYLKLEHKFKIQLGLIEPDDKDKS